MNKIMIIGICHFLYSFKKKGNITAYVTNHVNIGFIMVYRLNEGHIHLQIMRVITLMRIQTVLIVNWDFFF